MITTRAVEDANAPLPKLRSPAPNHVPNHDRNVPNQRGDVAKAGDAAKANAARAGESEARAGEGENSFGRAIVILRDIG